MKNNLFKKSMSVFLTALMLMTCWVFMPATHEHITAEAAGEATAEHNNNLVSGITFDTDVTTITDLNWAYNGDNQENEENVYKNILYSSDCNVVTANTGSVKLKDSGAATIQWYHGATTFLYDDVTTPQTGVMVAILPKGSSYNVRTYSSYIVSGTGLNLAHYWYGHDGRANFMWVISDPQEQNAATSDGSANGNDCWTVNSSTWFANKLQFTGSMSDTEFYRDITVTWGWKGNQKSQGTGSVYTYSATAGNHIYVINWKVLKEAYTEAQELIEEVKRNPGAYSSDSVKELVSICNDLINAHPNNHVNSSKNDPSGYATAASNAVSRLNNFSLAERKYDITFENMFSISDWRNSASANYNTDSGTVSVKDDETVYTFKRSSGGEHTTSSSYPNNHQATMYSMPVVAGKEYTVSFNITSSVSGDIASEIYLFWFDVNGNPVYNTAGSATFNNAGFSGNGYHEATFTAPTGATQAEIRFDNDCSSPDSTIEFNNIAVYPADRGTEQEISRWTNRATTKAFAYDTIASGALSVPVRKNYPFNGWYADSNANGVKDSGEAVTDATGAITATLTANVHHNLSADWLPVTQDVGYDNLFSLSKWAMSDSTNSSNTVRGNVVYDLDNGTITVNTTKDGEVYSDYGSAANHYQIAVEPNTEYIFEADMNLDAGTKGQMFVFFYDASGAGVTGAVYNSTAQTSPHIGIYPTTNGTHSIRFTTPADCTKMAIRVGATDVGTTATYSNIGFYKTSSYDAYAKDYAKVREPFQVGDVKTLIAPTREGFVFDGWKLKDGTPITSVEGLTASTTVYATWTKLWNVTYYNGDGTELATVKVKDGLTVGVLPSVVPTKDADANYSYEFLKWTLGGADFTAANTITQDVDVYPEFTNIAHSNFTYILQSDATCTANAIVTKKCGSCGYNFGNVTYNPAEDPNALSHTGWVAQGHVFTGGILDGSSTGNTDSDTHLLKCARYDDCRMTKEQTHVWAYKDTEGATCTVPGTVHWSCACGEEKTTVGELADDVHVNTETINIKAATCEEGGYTGDEFCNDCQKTVKTGSATSKLGHSFTNYVSNGDATCTEDGTETAKCDRCDVTDTRTDVDSKLGHNWTNTEKYLKTAADCENDAVYYKECSRCNISSEGKTDETWTKANTATGHNYTGKTRDNNNGTHSYLCKNGCDTYGYNGVKEAATDCTYGEWDSAGETQHVKTCTACNYELKEDHSFSAWVSTDLYKEADGQHSKECSVCKKVVTEDCTYTEESFAETCTTDGFTVHTCNECEHKYTTADKGKTGHNYTGTVKSYDGSHNFLCKNGCNTYGFNGITNARTTCTYEYKNNSDGKHQATCTVCNYSFEEVCTGGTATCTAPAECAKCETAYGATAPHSFTGTVVKLDGDKHAYLCVYCSTPGLYGVGAEKDATEACSGGDATCTALAVCTVCNDTHGALDTDDHKWGKWANVAGTETHKRVCEYNNAHTETDNCFSPDVSVIAPDCETAGYTLNTCDICGHTWQTAPTDPLGHYWGNWVNNNDGTHTRTCRDTTCKYGANGGAKTETASCTKENATFAVTAPTCTEGGYTTYTCKDCGYVWTDDATEATGHSYKDKKQRAVDKYKRTTADCTTDLTYWYVCDRCDVSAETEKDKYPEADLFWVSEAATGHSFTAKTATEDYLAAAATCTTKATYYYSCSVCGTSSEGTADEKTFEYGSALGHDWVQPAEDKLADYLATPADCITDATYYYVCNRDGCGVSSKDVNGNTWTDVDSKAGHDFDYEGGYTEGVEANCTDAGVVEHYTCKTCGKHFKADKVTEIAADKLTIPALKHDYKDIAAKAATCEEDGYTKHKQCQRCNYRNTDYKVIAALGHEFKAENGYYCDTVYNYHAYYCSRYDNCGAYGVDNVKYSVDMSGLDPEILGGIKCEFTGEYVNYEDANGVHSHKLTCVCGNVSSDVCVDAEPVHVAPTCEEDGYYVHTCDVCGFVWNVASDAEEDKATGHDFEGVAWTKIEGKDKHIRYCNNGCGKSEVADCSTKTPATTCGSQNVCDDCGAAFGEQIAHTWEEVEDADYLKAAATCETNAVYYKKCSGCDTKDETETWVKTGSKLSHSMTEYGYDISGWEFKPDDFNEEIKEPTCNAEGLTISYCVRCDYYLTKYESKDESAHDYGEKVNAGGNCATGITYKQTCKNCGDVITSIDNNVDHEYVLQLSKAATCEEASVELYACKNCGFTKETHETEAKGHVWGEIVEDKAPTCKNPGRGYYICTVCGEKSEFEEIAKIAHAWDKNDDGIIDADFDPSTAGNNCIYVEATSANCTADGYEGYFKCLDCSYDQHLDGRWTSIEGNVKPATGHKDTDGDGECDGLGCDKDLSGNADDRCGCICHKTNWFSKIIYKILRFFWKLFGIGKSCDCGTVHY